MKNVNNKLIVVVVLFLMIFGTMTIIPKPEAIDISVKNNEANEYFLNQILLQKDEDSNNMYIPRSEDDKNLYYLSEDDLDLTSISYVEYENDMGYNIDASDKIQASSEFYIGERVDDAPGRTRIGSLDPATNDIEDWYKFTVCAGQTIETSLDTSQDFDVHLTDTKYNDIYSSTLLANVSGTYFACVYANEGAIKGSYYIDITLNNQNDANKGVDAGNNINSALKIDPGEYYGYMDINDVEDWYSFSVNTGEGIYFEVDALEKSDYDLHLYDPDGIKVFNAESYGEDIIEYPAGKSGDWKIQIDMFPGWDTSKYPDNYFLYGSGLYTFTLELGGSYALPDTTVEPQPEIIPVANTFIINDDPSSTADEYSYIAAVPAANYISNGERYVSPIVYEGVDELTNWFGTVDDTTQYLIDDWNTYLQRHGMTSDEYIVNSDPIKAAAEIATKYWGSSDKAVVVCEGSDLIDQVESVIDDDFSMSSTPDIKKYYPGDFKEFAGALSIPMFIGKKWGAIHMIARGEEYGGDTRLVTPRYELVKTDDWPHPYDVVGPDYDTWYPITMPGLWFPEIDSETDLEVLEIIKYPGDRYKIPIDKTDCSIEVSLETDEPSTLLAYLVDPDGNLRRPTLPAWNGGEIQPIHWWNGGHWEHNFDDYRNWIVEPHTEFTFDLHYPMVGSWSLIIVPYYEYPDGYGGYIGNYHLTVNVRDHNPDRINAAISSANAAVLASMDHIPLLYVKKDVIPTETTNALSSLGVTEIKFVNLNDVSSVSLTGTVTKYTSMQQIIDAIKSSSHSDNYITFTSLGSTNGYFASAAMIAAYHTSPILSIHEAAEGYDTLDKLVKWEEYCGDYYHGCRTMGHLPALQEPTDITNPPSYLDIIIYYLKNKEVPPFGLDMKLQWYSQVYDSIYSVIDNYGLDLDGQEAYMFVSPRNTDIPSHISRVMEGNKSFAGQIPFDTPAMDTALICRDILYPALIYANPGRDVTSTVIMNHWETYDWTTNDGIETTNEFTSKVKETYSSNDRTYIGHTLWENILEQSNYGASVIYHSSHGTGGSGICCMYKNVEEQFPLAELTHENLLDFNWWDGWRGYYYDDRITKSPRIDGRVWFNPTDNPYNNLYDIVHFKWCDQLFTNLHSQMNLWQSCTTAHNFGPEIYLEHGAALYYGNSNTGRSPQTDMQDSWWFEDFMVKGLSIGEAHSKILWLFERDYTTNDPTSIYGVSSTDDFSQIQGGGEGLVNTWIIFGDPAMQIYSPLWTEPIPQNS